MLNNIATNRDQEADLAYMRSLTSAVLQRSPRYMVIILGVIGLAVASAIAWMSIAKLDIVVRGSGKVMPTQQIKIVQSLEGGVVSEILVREGEVVEPMQPLVKISDIAFSSSFEENRIKYYELRARMARLSAEANDTPFEADDEVTENAPEVMRSEFSLYESNLNQLHETLEIFEEQLSQNESELASAQAKARQVRRSLALMREELELKRPLVKRRLVSEVEFLQLKQKEAEIEGELETAELAAPRIESLIKESRRKIQQQRLDFQSKAKKELNEVAAEVSRIAETQQSLGDRLQRTTLRSPVKGTVTRLHVHTVGGVISASKPIVEIVPYEDTLLVEIKIKPADIANISIGQKARLKFSAYDFAIYGSLEGKVIFLSADTVTDQDGQSFFIARIKPVKAWLGDQSRGLAIRVGMTAEADILTDKKTILQYLFKPIRRGIKRSMQEG